MPVQRSGSSGASAEGVSGVARIFSGSPRTLSADPRTLSANAGVSSANARRRPPDVGRSRFLIENGYSSSGKPSRDREGGAPKRGRCERRRWGGGASAGAVGASARAGSAIARHARRTSKRTRAVANLQCGGTSDGVPASRVFGEAPRDCLRNVSDDGAAAKPAGRVPEERRRLVTHQAPHSSVGEQPALACQPAADPGSCRSAGKSARLPQLCAWGFARRSGTLRTPTARSRP